MPITWRSAPPELISPYIQGIDLVRPNIPPIDIVRPNMQHAPNMMPHDVLNCQFNSFSNIVDPCPLQCRGRGSPSYGHLRYIFLSASYIDLQVPSSFQSYAIPTPIPFEKVFSACCWPFLYHSLRRPCHLPFL